jgi:hypothetical protein
MQKLQREWTAKGVAWLTVSSSGPGKQGHVGRPKAAALMKKKSGEPTAVLLDPDGRVGRIYGAKTTPHMFVIDAKGRLVCAGGFDDKPSTDRADVATAKNCVGRRSARSWPADRFLPPPARPTAAASSSGVSAVGADGA